MLDNRRIALLTTTHCDHDMALPVLNSNHVDEGRHLLYGVGHGNRERQAELARPRAQARAGDRLTDREHRHERRVLRPHVPAEPCPQAVLRDRSKASRKSGSTSSTCRRNRRAAAARAAREGRARARGAHAPLADQERQEREKVAGPKAKAKPGPPTPDRRPARTPPSSRRVPDAARPRTLSARPRGRAHPPAHPKRDPARRRIERAEGRSVAEGRRLAARARRALALSRRRGPSRRPS